MASGQIEDHFADTALMGELSLDGRLRHVSGVLPFVAMCHAERIGAVVVPAEDLREARMVGGVRAYGLGSLGQLQKAPAEWVEEELPAPECLSAIETYDLSVVRGQEHVKRAVEVAASGGHNLMMQGPPGSGKTLIARALPGLVAPLAPLESIEVSKIYSVAALLSRAHPLLRERPF